VYSKILVGIDGSEASLRAARRAAELASKTGAKLSLLTVVPPPTVWLGELMTPEVVDTTPLVEAAKERLKNLAERLREEFNVESDWDVVLGEPADSIIEYAVEGGYDLIVLGRRGLSRLDRLFLGSITRKVLERSPIDVLVTV